jgi:hypothetical protein
VSSVTISIANGGASAMEDNSTLVAVFRSMVKFSKLINISKGLKQTTYA